MDTVTELSYTPGSGEKVGVATVWIGITIIYWAVAKAEGFHPARKALALTVVLTPTVKGTL